MARRRIQRDELREVVRYELVAMILPSYAYMLRTPWMNVFLLLALLSTLLVTSAHAQAEAPLFETRAVWFATVLRDGTWPPEGTGPATQSAELRERIRQAHARGLNTFIFQAVARGDALYPSARLPWSPHPKGPGEDPGYDPLAVAVEEAHRLGMELHAWINVFRVGDRNTLETFDGVSDPAHVAYAHPDWVEDEGNGSLWLVPSNEDARSWLVDNVLEIVTNYDIDAVHFDFIRYPQGGLPGDGDRFQADPQNADYAGIDDWRRDQITRFVRDAYAAVVAEKPWVKVGSTPIGNYRNNGWPALFAYSDVFQASREWLQEGVHDYLAPQIYWNIADAPRFDVLAAEWVDEAAGRPIFTGIAAYKDEVKVEIGEEIDVARAAGAAGQVFFRFDHFLETAAQIETRYPHPALPAPMTHRFEAAPPTVPDGLALTSDGDLVTLAWTPSSGTASDPLRAYAVFRRAGEAPDPARAEDLFAVLDAAATSFSERFADQPEPPIMYRVAAVSRLGVLSEATEAVSTETVAVAVEPGMPSSALRLGSVYPNPVREAATVTFELTHGADVSLVVYDLLGRAVAVLAEGWHAPGSHQARLGSAALPAGTYYCVLRVDDHHRVQPFVVAR